MLIDFRTQGYRSIKDIWLQLQPINVIIGKNGTGKSNLYRAIYLLSCAANGRFATAIAEEGGIESALWAGDWKVNEKRELKISMRTKDFEYNLVCGAAGDVTRPEFFKNDPVVRSEETFRIKEGKKNRILQRKLRSIFIRNTRDKEVEYTSRVADNESILSALKDPVAFPDLFKIREEILSWRFYHGFRKDIDSPLRGPQLGVMTSALSHDGSDLAAALATIFEAGDSDQLSQCISEAFPNSKLQINRTKAGLRLALEQPGLARPSEGSELSDGTLQYLCLLAALLSIAPPPVMILNEPENSLHPRLLKPLANLIMNASSETQIWLTTHSQDLADAITDLSGYIPYELTKVDGQTRLVGAGLGGYRDDSVDQEEDV